MNNLHGGLPVGLFDGTPGSEAGTSARLQDAMQLRQRALRVGEEHHPKAAGRKIKAPVGERKRVGVRLLRRKVGELLVQRPFGGNFKQFRTDRKSTTSELQSLRHL